MIYVIAGNYSQFRDFCWRNDLTPRHAKYVGSMYDLRGLGPDTQFAAYGTWQERKDIHQIHETLHYILSKPAKKETPVW